ncbi:MAG: DUF4176 domain-containing protein [Streptococcaceae bacterium]|jgi:hypothetical protein|nr:DUF4176 domain-containing protein [Streptococcaceae bacterium]
MNKELEKKVSRLQSDFESAKKSWRTLKSQVVPDAPDLESLENPQIFKSFEFLPDEQRGVIENQQKLTQLYLTFKSNFSELQEQVAVAPQALSEKESEFVIKILDEMILVLRRQLNEFNQTKSVFETSWQFYNARLQDFAILRSSTTQNSNSSSFADLDSIVEVSATQTETENLPIGSVVLLKKRTVDIPIMIIASSKISENESKKEYSAVIYPAGYTEGSHIFSFDYKDIDKVLFRGYKG